MQESPENPSEEEREKLIAVCTILLLSQLSPAVHKAYSCVETLAFLDDCGNWTTTIGTFTYDAEEIN